MVKHLKSLNTSRFIYEKVLNLSFSRETINATARILPPTKTFTKVHKPYKIVSTFEFINYLG